MSTYAYVKAPRKLTPLMRKKLERFFAVFDRGSSHIIEREDALALVRKLAARASPALRSELEGKMDDFWNNGLHGGRRPIRQIEFLADTTLARSDPASHKLELTRTLPELADLFFRACASDGRVSRADFAFFQRAVGASDHAQNRRTFAALDADGDGFLSATDFTQAVAHFFTSEDESHPANLLFGALDVQLGFVEALCRHTSHMLSLR